MTFKVVLESDEFGRERFAYATLPEALAAIKRLHLHPDEIERVIGPPSTTSPIPKISDSSTTGE